MRLSRKRLSARANAFIFPRLSPLPAYTAESDVYEDNEDSKLNKRSESQKGELHISQSFLNLMISMFKRGDGPNQRSQEPRRTQNEKVSH